MGSIIMTPEEAQEETSFLLFLRSTDEQGHNVTSYDPERRLAEQEITSVLQKSQINQLSELTFCDDITGSLLSHFELGFLFIEAQSTLSNTVPPVSSKMRFCLCVPSNTEVTASREESKIHFIVFGRKPAVKGYY